MKVLQGVNTLTLTSDPAGSRIPTRLPSSVLFLPEPSLRSPSYPLPLSLFNSFLRSLTPPSGPSPGPSLPPLAPSQTRKAGTFWGPPDQSRRSAEPEQGLLPRPPTRARGFRMKRESKGQGLRPGSAAAGLGQLRQHLPQTAGGINQCGS